MKEKLRRSNLVFSSLLVFLIVLSGCISIGIQPHELESADGLRFQPPKSPPYEEVKVGVSDRTWKNQISGNTISFVSECGQIGSVDLKSIAKSVVHPTQMKITSQTKEANRLITQAKDTRRGLRLKLVTERTKECIYNFAYLATDTSFESEEIIFDNFLRGFKEK